MNVVLLHLPKYNTNWIIEYLCFDVLLCVKLYLMTEDTDIYLEKVLFTIIACYMTYNHAQADVTLRIATAASLLIHMLLRLILKSIGPHGMLAMPCLNCSHTAFVYAYIENAIP